MIDGLVISVHGPGTAATLLNLVSDVYSEAFSHDQTADQGLTWLVDAWPRRLTANGFRLVLAEREGGVVGAVYGHQLMSDKWWDNLLDPLPAGMTQEHPGRTVAIIDMMVRPSWRRHGIAEVMHTHLLAAGAEERATLLVEPTNSPARNAYSKWGYQRVSRIVPPAFPSGDPYDVMVKQLKPTD